MLFKGIMYIMSSFHALDLEQTADNSPRCSFQEAHPSSGHTYDRINDKFLKTRGISGSRNVCEIFVGKLDKALNFRQSEYISEARNEVRELFDLIKREDARDFRKPTRYCLQVVSRGNDLFFDNSVSFSLKHGLLVLDSSNGGALFYSSLLNVLGVLALEISEFHIAKKIFSILVAFHNTSDATSRLRDLAAAFNNRGCLSLIVGEFNHAKSDFDNSVRHLNYEKHKRQCFSWTESLIIGVHNNVCCLNFMSRNFTKCIEKQNELLNLCKSKAPELPMQTVFMVLHNQAKTNIALGSMARAETELKWLNSYCKALPKRERHDLLLDFVSLQLCEVLLLSGKPAEANNVYPFERLTSECILELMPRFGGIYFDLMIETFEKRIDVLVEFGKRKNALECLQKQIILVKEHFGVRHFFVSSLLYKEGCTLKLEGKLSDASEKFKCSSEILRDIFGEKHPLLIKCYMSLGGVSLRLGRESESHLSFHRAMENVEVIHQVSFPNQLSIRYIEMTSNPKRKPFGMFQKRDVEEQMIDGLVAEHGLALAVLLSPLNTPQKQIFPGTTKKGAKQLPGKIAEATQSEIFLIVSQKTARDLFLSGQTFLRLGMKNEAGAFFQLAGELCQTNHLVQGQSLPPLVSLFNLISQTNFANQSEVKENSDVIRFLEELKEDAVNSANENDAESKTEAKEKLNFDSQMDLKPPRSSSVIARPVQLRSSQQSEEIILGLNPNFVARHAVTEDNLHYPDFDGAEWKDPLYQYSEEHPYLANVSGNLSRKKSFNLYGQEVLQNSHNSSSISRHSPESDPFDGGATMQRSVHSLARSPSLLPKEEKSWHFPPLQGTTENHILQRKYRENYGPGHLQLTQDHGPLFQSPNPDSSNGMVVASTNFNNNTDSYGDSSLHSTYTREADSVTVHEDQRDLIEDNIETHLEDLEKVMSRTVGPFASIVATETQVEIKEQNTEKVGIQEQAMSGVDNGQTEIAGGVYSEEQTALIPRNEQTTATKKEDGISPIQESPRPACGHYQRRCLVRFPCCGRFYPCHRCHNESAACTDDQARAINATHIRCIICYHEQVVR